MSHHVITGGAGFIGTHLTRRLLLDGNEVTVVDDLSTGRRGNLYPGAKFVEANVAEHGWLDEIDQAPDMVWHLASPCSPPDYQIRRLDTLLANSHGTGNALELARSTGARFVLASTSEVYGDPLVHPQPEDYWGNVSSVGPRSCYDEGKRYAEALTMACRWEYGIDARIVRIFNTYGPHMPDDGRVVIRFLTAALNGEPIEIHGNGLQTRSFSYVTDTVDGLIRVAESDLTVCNVGSEQEITVRDLAANVLAVTGSDSDIKYIAPDVDDPRLRCPDLTRLRGLGWALEVPLRQGLRSTVAWLQESQ